VPRAERDELLDLEADTVRSFSSLVSATDTDDNDSPLAALATLVRSPSRTKEGLDDVDSFLSSASIERTFLEPINGPDGKRGVCICTAKPELLLLLLLL